MRLPNPVRPFVPRRYAQPRVARRCPACGERFFGVAARRYDRRGCKVAVWLLTAGEHLRAAAGMTT